MPASPTHTAAVRPSAAAAPATRIRSIDVLRGFDLFWIVGGAGIARALERMEPNAVTTFLQTQLTHADWEGLRFYDVIYPLFLFLVGCSIMFSLDRARATETRGALLRRILRRGLLLYVFGFIYHGGLAARWPEVRLSGVLQLIAFAYVGAASFYLFFGARVRTLVGATAAILAGYGALLAWTPFPDVALDAPSLARLETQAHSQKPADVLRLAPGRVSGRYEAGHNLSNFLDYRFLPGKKVNGAYESQGLLSPLPATAICLLGILTARWLRRSDISPQRQAMGLLLAGVAVLGLGLLWSLSLPLVKKLWTPSFCLVTGGISAVLLAVFHLVIDGWRLERWGTPFLWLGSNSIAIYLGYELIRFDRIAERVTGGDVRAWCDAHLARGAGALLSALVALGLALWLARFLHQRRIFLRV